MDRYKISKRVFHQVILSLHKNLFEFHGHLDGSKLGEELSLETFRTMMQNCEHYSLWYLDLLLQENPLILMIISILSAMVVQRFVWRFTEFLAVFYKTVKR